MEIIGRDSGIVYDSKYIPPVTELKLKIPRSSSPEKYICIGNMINTLPIHLTGALVRICNLYLHFETTLLYREGAAKEMKRLKSEDFALAIQKSKGTTRRYLKELQDHKALLRIDKHKRYFVNPRFVLRGFKINPEEFHKLLEVDEHIYECLADKIEIRKFQQYRSIHALR